MTYPAYLNHLDLNYDKLGRERERVVLLFRAKPLPPFPDQAHTAQEFEPATATEHVPNCRDLQIPSNTHFIPYLVCCDSYIFLQFSPKNKYKLQKRSRCSGILDLNFAGKNKCTASLFFRKIPAVKATTATMTCLASFELALGIVEGCTWIFVVAPCRDAYAAAQQKVPS